MLRADASMDESSVIVSATNNSSTNNAAHDDGNANSAGRRAAVASLKSASDAKRRMEHMTSGVDRRIVYAVVLLFATYLVLNITAMSRMPTAEGSNDQLFFERYQANAEQRAGKYVSPPGGIKSPAHHAKVDTTFGLPKQYKSYKDIADVDVLQHVFPIHAGDDTEEIDHPGALLASKRTNPDLPSKMTVPEFWRPTAYGPNGVRHFLGEHGARLMEAREAEQIGSFTQMPSKDGTEFETVYVSIASYRDYECRATLEDIFERAKYPERLRVAVIDQRTGEDDSCTEPRLPCSQDSTQTLCKYQPMIDVFEVDAKLSVGPVFARHLAHRMYRGEYFAMQVDSHVRFTQDWDVDLIGQWKSANNEMAVMTTYLSDIIGSIDPVTHKNHHPGRPIMCKTGYEGNGKLRHLRHGQQPEGIPGIHNQPTLHPFWAAGFSFARGHFVVQVPYDQYLPMVFQGEEISIGLRGFTYGYDYYTAERSVAFHMYAVKENKARRQRVKLFWENGSLYPGSGLAGMKRLNGIIGMGDPEDEYFTTDEDEYGLGKVRQKQEFFKLYGIHPETKTVEGNLCKFVGKPMQRKFIPFLRRNRMGIDFSKTDFEFVDPDPE